MTTVFTNADKIKKVLIVNPKSKEPYVLLRTNCTKREASRILKQFVKEESIGFDSWVVIAKPRRLSRKFDLTHARFADVV